MADAGPNADAGLRGPNAGAGLRGPNAVDRQITVVQVRSAIGSKPKHRGTLKALGLGRIGKSRVLPDRPEIRGMVAQVTHLVRVEEGGLGSGSGRDGQAERPVDETGGEA